MLKLQIPVNSKGDVFEFKLAKEKVTIGRRHDNDIRVKETYVSAYHAELLRGKDGRVYLRDRDSSNGTYLNGKRIREKVEIFSGDVLNFGTLRCHVTEVADKVNGVNRVNGHSRSKIYANGNGSGTPVMAASPALAVGESTVSVSVKKETVQRSSSKSPTSLPIDGVAYTAPDPGPSLKTQLQTIPPVNGLPANHAPLASELEALKSQFELNRNELRKAKDELKARAAEIEKIREKTAKEDAIKLEKIKNLEDILRSKETSGDDLNHRLRLAGNRVDQLESELAHHRTDMSAEIKAAMQRLAYTKNDNVLLQGTLEALEADRSKHRDENLRLSQKLSKTREGFSFLLQNTGKKLDESNTLRSDLEQDHNNNLARLRNLENELDSLRDDFSKSESDYRQKLANAEKEQLRTSKSEQTLIKDLEIANEKLKCQKADIVKLEASIESLEAEKDAAEEDWGSRVLELTTTNKKLVGFNKDLESLEAKVKETTANVKKLKSEKSLLEVRTKDLRGEKVALSVETEKVTKERNQSTATIEKIREESKKASHKLDSILQNLHESEQKVSYLRNLEFELEKSVLRAQRSALSRKGIYREDEETYTTIWPETEQMICRELIERLELLEDLLKRYQQNWFFPKVAEQLNLLRDSFMVLLKNHSVDQFDLEPGTELSVESRKKIQLISVDDLGDPKLKRLSNQQSNKGKRTKVLQTLRPGYIYSKGGQDVIIRKAEVIVA